MADLTSRGGPTYHGTVGRCPGAGDHGPHVVLEFGPEGDAAVVVVSYDQVATVRQLVVQLAAAAEWLEMEQAKQPG